MILVEDTAFPSDSYAVRSQAVWHGLDPDETVVRLRARDGRGRSPQRGRGRPPAAPAETGSRSCSWVRSTTTRVSCSTWRRSPRAGHAAGAVVAFDLAHAAGNVPSGAARLGRGLGRLVHLQIPQQCPGRDRRSVRPRAAPRRPEPAEAARLVEHRSDRPGSGCGPRSTPLRTADAWSLSNPPILAMAPVLLSLEMFDRVGMPNLRARSIRLTAYLEGLLGRLRPGPGPRDHTARPRPSRRPALAAVLRGSRRTTWRSGCGTSTA